jgi:hypothetical protein
MSVFAEHHHGVGAELACTLQRGRIASGREDAAGAKQSCCLNRQSADDARGADNQDTFARCKPGT